MEPTELQHTAEIYGWNTIKTKHPTLLSFKNSGIRINIYYTTGTVGICIPKKREKFLYKQTTDQVEKLFETILEGI